MTVAATPAARRVARNRGRDGGVETGLRNMLALDELGSPAPRPGRQADGRGAAPSPPTRPPPVPHPAGPKLPPTFDPIAVGTEIRWPLAPPGALSPSRHPG